MPVRERRNREPRRQQRDLVNHSYERLSIHIDGNFGPGYFNSPGALAAENDGLNIGEAVLGHVIASSPDTDAQERARELLNRVSGALVPSEVENRCHNLHGACALMLDELNVPVALVRGSVYATGKGGRSFSLNALDGLDTPVYRPGHSWLITPSWRVADIALVHQAGVPGHYSDIRATLPPVMTVTSSETSEPIPSWWRFGSGLRLTDAMYTAATRYQHVIGWSQYTSGSTTVRYLPSGITLPKEAELAEVEIRIGGLSPREFFDQNASDLIPS